MKQGTLWLVPWHLGNQLDVTLNSVRAARRLRVLVCEEPAVTRAQFQALGVDCGGKEFLQVTERESSALLRRVKEVLAREDAGLIASGGVPCFIDPGAWLVERLREQGRRIVALPGASALSTMLSLSGIEWIEIFSRGSFVFFVQNDPRGLAWDTFRAVVGRDEPVFVFLKPAHFRDCLRVMKPLVGERRVTAFFDLSKVPPEQFPYADAAMTHTCARWLARLREVDWDRVTDMGLMVHPPGGRR